MSENLGIRFSATDQTQAAFNSVNANMARLNNQARVMRNRMGVNDSFMRRHRRTVQQVGFQVGDFATQIAGGQSAMLAFTQQGGQMLQFFGPLGAASAALLAIFGSLAIAITRSGASFDAFNAGLTDVQPLLSAIGAAFSVVLDLLIDGINLIVNNLDTLIIALGVVVGLIAIKYVRSVTLATAVTASWSAAIGVLSAVMRLIPLLLIISLVTAVIQGFIRLIRETGSVGNALKLLGAVFVEQFDRIVDYLNILLQEFIAWGASVVAEVISTAQTAVTKFIDFFFKPLFTTLDSFYALMGSPINMSEINKAAGKTDVLTRGFKNAAAAARETAAAIRLGAARVGTPATDKLMDILFNRSGERIDVRDFFGGSGDENGAGSTGAGRVAEGLRKLNEKVTKDIKDRWEDVSSSITDKFTTALRGMLNGTVTIRDGLRNLFVGILDDLITESINPMKEIISDFVRQSLRALSNNVGGVLGQIFGLSGSFFGGSFAPKAGIGLSAGSLVDANGLVKAPSSIMFGRGRKARISENRPEGVFPVVKGPDGKLGIRAMGGPPVNGGGVINHFHIDARGAQEGVDKQIAKALDSYSRRQSSVARNDALRGR